MTDPEKPPGPWDDPKPPNGRLTRAAPPFRRGDRAVLARAARGWVDEAVRWLKWPWGEA